MPGVGVTVAAVVVDCSEAVAGAVAGATGVADGSAGTAGSVPEQPPMLPMSARQARREMLRRRCGPMVIRPR